ncbi:MAG: biotin carboxylase N-terminal domain-containing protein, partial [Alphaproteobacteria bacterium]
MQFSRILIANRGEIAVRIISTARRMGYETVAIYSEADRDALHVATADESVLIGGAPASESYLNADNIMAAVRTTAADAVHPGYGFLAEDADFARKCDEAGMVFIGPAADAIELMGNKRLARLRMREAGVGCVPGYDGRAQDVTALRAAAEEIGFPIMIKAAAGGGGRGLRRVEDASALGKVIKTARAESRAAFGTDELI